MTQRGSLIVVGTGIEAVAQVTVAARGSIEHADEVLYLTSDPLTAEWIRMLNACAESLLPYYETDKYRNITYRQQVERILQSVRRGRSVCAAFYGHPGVFAEVPHEAVRRARAEGFPARMLPGVSAFDCLIADLGLDPGEEGSQMYEATDFLIYERRVDFSSPLILWQVGSVGHLDFQPVEYSHEALAVLAEVLVELYGPDHEVTLYRAATLSVFQARIERLALRDLASAHPTPATTLLVPPRERRPINVAMARRVGLDEATIETLVKFVLSPEIAATSPFGVTET